MTLLTYPDGDEISYAYNDRALLQAIPGGPNGNIISSIGYAPSGQMVQTDYGNGVRTIHAYDRRLRLKNLVTISQPSTLNQQLINFVYDFDGVSNIRSIADQRPSTVAPSGDPRRNTQLFSYDDLYRLTRARYSLNVPGEALRNDGEINYRYDRIGNMLAQTSTITNLENGLPIANLGQMDSGGTLGRWNRTGRTPTAPPGPHAVTTLRNTQYATRNYSYDANGNMTIIDGLTNTWDFKDRLVAVEDSDMRAEYTYDHTGRRIIKRVDYKPSSGFVRTNHESRITTLYINKYFEVREHDAPTKYVWNGDTRVARVTGSLSTNLRVQRLRVWPGWNLVSLAVAATGSAFDLQPLVFRWEPNTRAWLSVSSNDTLPADTVLWLEAVSNATLTVTGGYSDPTTRTLSAGGDFVPGTGLEVCNLKCAVSNLDSSSVCAYDAALARWLASMPAPLESQSDLPFSVAPGKAVFAGGATALPFAPPSPDTRICYYHQDHLGSTAQTSGEEGHESLGITYFPYGQPHCEYPPGALPEPYGFTQKERDMETRLHYFEKRFLSACAGRFCQVDIAALGTELLNPAQTQTLTAYAYGRNNPIMFCDPTGAKPEWLKTGIEKMLERHARGEETFTRPMTQEEWAQGLGGAAKSALDVVPVMEGVMEVSLFVATGGLGDAIALGKAAASISKSAVGFAAKRAAQRAERAAFRKAAERAIVLRTRGLWDPLGRHMGELDVKLIVFAERIRTGHAWEVTRELRALMNTRAGRQELIELNREAGQFLAGAAKSKIDVDHIEALATLQQLAGGFSNIRP